MAATVTPVEHRFRAMGTDVHLVVVGGPARAVATGEARVRELEARWSRFVATSEVSALNRQPGQPVVVSPDTRLLVERSVAAWRATGGRFDPTVGPSLIAHGYDRDFAALVEGPVAPAPAPVGPAPGPAGIRIVPDYDLVVLPAGVTLDPGGIGKGLAADLTAARLLDDGAEGVLVNIGGDLRLLGRAPGDDGWVVSIDDPLDTSAELLRLSVPGGAIATSSRLRRRWRTAAGGAHHLIDPCTGRPMETDVVAATVVAGEAWWAEALTKYVFMTGPAGLGDLDGVHALVVTADGHRHVSAGLEGCVR